MKHLEYSQEFLQDRKLFWTSDLHFDHGNIIKYCNRPFISKQEMNHSLIQNWNKTVNEQDIVFVLGDFCFGGKSKWRQLLNSLKGTKYLILGNHDQDTDIPEECFELVCDLLKVSVQDKETNKWETFILSHRPFLCFEGMFKEYKQLFGHCHSRVNNTGSDAYLLQYLVNSYDVGVDNNNFTPVSYNNLKVIFNKIKNHEYRCVCK